MYYWLFLLLFFGCNIVELKQQIEEYPGYCKVWVETCQKTYCEKAPCCVQIVEWVLCEDVMDN